MKQFLRLVAMLCSVALLLGAVPFTVAAQTSPLISAVPLPQDPVLQAIAQASDGEAFILGEDISKRQANVKHFRMSDGTYLAAVYNDAVHYLAADGYREIDNTLQSVHRGTASYWQNTDGDVTVQLPSSLSPELPVYLEYAGYRLGIAMHTSGGTALITQPAVSAETQLKAHLNRLAGQTELQSVTVDASVSSLSAKQAAQALLQEQITPRKATSSVLYRADAAAVGYTLQGRTLKESITLPSLPEQTAFAYTIQGNGLQAVLQDDRSVAFYAPDQAEPVFTLQAPFMYDAAGEHSYAVSVSLRQTDAGWLYTVTPDRDWLADAARAYPVVLDPTVTAGSSYATVRDTTGARTTLTDTQFNTLTNEHAYLKAGKWNGTELVSLVYADLPEHITSSCRIVKATLRLHLYRSGQSSAATDLQLNARRILTAWGGNNSVLQPSELPQIESTVLDAVIVNDSNASMHQQDVVFDITQAAQRWVTDAANHGILIEANELTNWKYARFYDSDHGTQACAPTFTYVYRDTKGIEDYWTYTSVDAGRFGSVLVNNYTGALVSVQQLDGIGGNRMPVSLQAVYNSAALQLGSSRLGIGWRTNMDWKITAVTSDDLTELGFCYLLTDGDGTDHYFYTDDNNVIRDEDGLGYTLTKNSDNTYTVAVQGGGEMRFDTSGALSAIEDTNGNTLTVTRQAGALKTVTDGAGRTYTVTRDATILMKSLTAPDGSTVTFTYRASHPTPQPTTQYFLERITYPDGEYTDFTYLTGTALLQSISDSASGLVTDIAYIEVEGENGPRHRVSSVSRGVTDTAVARAAIYRFAYQHNATDITLVLQNDTQSSEQTVSYRFNNWGQTVAVVDHTSGMAEYYEYGRSGTEKTGEENRLLSSSAVMSSVVNQLRNTSFESSSNWTRSPAASYSTTLSRSGSRALVLSQAAAGTAGYASQGITTQTASDGITLSAYISTNGATLTGQGVRLRIVSTIATGTTEAVSGYLNHTEAGQWQRLSVTLDEPILYPQMLGVYIETDAAFSGTVYIDDVQLEQGFVANPYTLLQNGKASSKNDWTYYQGTATATGTVAQSALSISGSAAQARRWQQTVSHAGKAGDVYRFGGWGKAASLQTDYTYDADTAPFKRGQASYRLRLTFLTAAGAKAGEYVAAFNTGDAQWQFVSGKAVATADYARLTIALEYDYNVNTALFKDIFLDKEAFGQSYTYDESGNLISSVDAAASKSSFAYQNDQLAALVNPTGSRYGYSYEQDTNNLLFAHSSDGQLYSFTYDAHGNALTTRTDAAATATTLAAGKTYIIRNAANGKVLMAPTVASGKGVALKPYQDLALERWQLSAKSATNTYGLTVGTLALSSSSSALSLAAAGTASSQSFVITAVGDGTFRIKTAQGTYLAAGDGDAVQRLALDADNEAMQWVFTAYAPQGDTLYMTSSATYSADGNYLASQTDTLGNTVSYNYDSLSGLLQSATDALGNTTAYSYDEMRRITQVQSGGSTVQYIYDKDRLAAVLAGNGAVRYGFAYDALGRRTATTVGNGTLSRTLSTNVYDHRGLLSTLLYGNGASVSYTYDALGRTVQTAFGDTPAFAYAYLADGKTGLAIDYINGHRTRYGYDFAGRLASLVRTAGGDDGARILQLDYTYEDAANRLQKLAAKWQAASVTDSYTYGNAANGQMPDAVYRLQSVVAASGTSFTFSRNYSYDALGRLTFAGYGNTPNGITFTYAAGSGENQTTARIAQLSWINQLLSYTYDANGNITSVSQNGALLERYAYDALGQLVRVDSTVTDTTTLFVYDAGGNLQSRSVYPFAEGEPTGTPDVVVYGYNDASWADLLTAYDGQTLTYDAIGNPLQWRDGMTFSWQNGRQLAAFAAGSVSASYTYGEGGIRTAKTVTNADGSVTNITYHTAGGSPLGESRITTLNGETVSTVEIQYVYDASGTAYGISAFVTDAENTTTQYNYYYMHNLQGDVIGLWHQYAGPVCYYTYDAWGKLLSVTDANGNAITDANHIAHINPIRYRGYYYDTESGLYYLQSRYYDPEVGRFVNGDSFDIVTATPMALTDKNLFAYCDNNPIMRLDNGGEFWDFILDVVSVVVSVVEVCKNPASVSAWVGLAADVASLAVPGLTGGGAIVKTSFASSDNVVDAAKAVYKKMVGKGSEIKKATGSYEIIYKSGHTYVGKGGYKRAIKSAERNAHKYSDEVASITWKSAPDARTAMIDEYKSMCKYGGPNNSTIANGRSYNQIWSPGRNYYLQDYGTYYTYKGRHW